MSFSIRGFENHSSSGGGAHLLSYRTDADTLAAVTAAGYFDMIAGQLSVGDLIAITASDGTGLYRIADIAAASPKVSLQPWGAIEATATWDPASAGAGAAVSTTVTATGAALGDVVQVSFDQDLSGCILSGYVSAADTVTVVLFNPGVAAVDLASGTVKVRVLK